LRHTAVCMRGIAQFLRANPQAAILLGICVVLGFGTLIAVLFASAGGSSTGGANSPVNDGGVITLGHALRALIP
jgi:hypothetical protein